MLARNSKDRKMLHAKARSPSKGGPSSRQGLEKEKIVVRDPANHAQNHSGALFHEKPGRRGPEDEAAPSLANVS